MMKKISIFTLYLLGLVVSSSAQSFTESPFYWHYVGFRQFDYSTSYLAVKADEGIAKKALINFSPDHLNFTSMMNLGYKNPGDNSFANGRGELSKIPVLSDRKLFTLKSEFASDLSLYNSLKLDISAKKNSIRIYTNQNYNNHYVDKNNDHLTDQPLTNNYNIGIDATRNMKNKDLRINFLTVRKDEFRGIDTSENYSVFNLRSELMLNAGALAYNTLYKNFSLHAKVNFYQYNEDTKTGIYNYKVDEQVVSSMFLARYMRKKLRLDFEGGYRNYYSEENLNSDQFINDRTNYHFQTGAQFKIHKDLELIAGFRSDFNSAWGNILQPMATLLYKNGYPYGARIYYSRSFHYNAPLLLASSLLVSDRKVIFESIPEPDLFDKFGIHLKYSQSWLDVNFIYNFLLYQRRYRMDVYSSPGEIIFTNSGNPGYDHFFELNTRIRPPGRYELQFFSKIDIARTEFSGKMRQLPFIPVSTTGMKNKIVIGHRNNDKRTFISLDFYYSSAIPISAMDSNSEVKLPGVFSAHLNSQILLSSLEFLDKNRFTNMTSLQFGIENLFNNADIPGTIVNSEFSSVDFGNFYGIRRFYLGFTLKPW